MSEEIPRYGTRCWPSRCPPIESVAPSGPIGRATAGAVLGPLAALGFLAWLGAHDAACRTVFVFTLTPGLASAIVFGAWVKDPDIRRATATPAAVDRRPPPPGFLRFLLAVGFFALGDFAPTLLMLRTTEVMSPVVGTWRAATLVVAL